MEWELKRLTQELEFRGYSEHTIACYTAIARRFLSGEKIKHAAISFLKREVLVTQFKLTSTSTA